MKQAFCLYVIMFVMFILFTDLFCECAEGFEGKKVSVEYKSVTFEGKPALLVVDSDESVVKDADTPVTVDSEGTAKMESSDIQRTKETEDVIDKAKEVIKTIEPPDILKAYNESEFKINTCESFVKMSEEGKLDELTISKLVPSYDSKLYTDEQNKTLKSAMDKMNKDRNETAKECQKHYDKIAEVIDEFSKSQKINPGSYDPKPNGTNCGEYASPSFDAGAVRKTLEEGNEVALAGTEFNAFRNNIKEMENEMMELVNTKFKACLTKFKARPKDKAQFINGRMYMYVDKDGNVNTAGTRNTKLAKKFRWVPNDILDASSDNVLGTQIKDANSVNCVSVESKDSPKLIMSECDVSDEMQHFAIKDLGNNRSTICHKDTKQDDFPMCVTSASNSLSKNESDDDAFRWRIYKTV
jgi:hypothetical protein